MEAVSAHHMPLPGGLSSPDDTERFRAVLFATHGDIIKYCQRRLTAERVDDTVAEVFTAVWQGLERVPMGAEARPWVFGIARNKVAEAYRSETRSTELAKRLQRDRIQQDPARQSDHDRIDEQLNAQSNLAAVEAAAETLGADDVELLRLLGWERLTTKEISIVLGCSQNAAKIRIHRMRRRLRLAIKAHHNTPTATPTPTHQSSLEGTDK